MKSTRESYMESRVAELEWEVARLKAKRDEGFRRSDAELAHRIALRARVAELEAALANHPDMKRLDLIDKIRGGLVTYCEAIDGSEYCEVTGPLGQTLGVGRTVRQAIDDAMPQGGAK